MTGAHGPLAALPCARPCCGEPRGVSSQAAAPLGFWWLDPGWPAPEDPGGDDDAELDGRSLICDRLVDEAGWLRQCVGGLTHL